MRKGKDFKKDQTRIKTPQRTYLKEVDKRVSKINYAKGLKTLGFLYNYQTPLATNNLLQGIEDYCRENNLNLLCAIGAPFHPTSDIDKQRIRIFDFISKRNVDGLILSRKVGRSLTGEQIKKLLRKYWPLPTVNIGEKVAGIPSVLYSIHDSIKEIVSHLVFDHGYKKILFIRGRETNKYARQRFESFCKIMQELKLRVYYIEPAVDDYYYEGGKDAIRILIEEKRQRFDAIVAENNLMALGILDALRSYQIEVPKNIAVVGIYELEADTPFTIPLTSIWVPFYEHGRIAAHLCLQRLKAKKAPPTVVTKSELKLGTTCGCFYPEVSQKPTSFIAVQGKLDFDSFFKNIAGFEPSCQSSKLEIVRQFAKLLLQAFEEEIKGNKPELVIKVLHSYAEVFKEEGIDLIIIHKVLAFIYAKVMSSLEQPFARERVQGLFYQAYYIIYRIIHNEEAYHFLLENQRSILVNKLVEELFGCQDIEQLKTIVENKFIAFGIKGFFLGIYANKQKKDRLFCPLAILDGRLLAFKIKTSGEKGDSFVKRVCKQFKRRFTLLGVPLFYEQEELGIGLFEIENNDLNVLEKLRHGLSYALENISRYTILKTRTQNLEATLLERNQTLEETNKRLKEEIGVRKSAEQRLAKSEENYRRWFNESFTADFVADDTGKILACNPSFARIFGFNSVKDALKASFTDFYPLASAVEDFFTLLKVVKKIEYYEAELVTAKGNRINVIGHIVGIFDRYDKLTGMRGYLVDNTAHKLLEEELRQSQKMEAIGRLSGGIAHDFNNLLTGIMGYSELLLQSMAEDDPLRKEVEEIKKAAKSASSLTRQLLAFSRKQVLSPTVLNFNEVILGMHEMLMRLIGEDIKLNLDLRDGLYKVKADRGQLEQVVLNLVINSRDALPNGGEITIRTANISVTEAVHIHNLLLKAGEYVLLEINDNGVGMDEETQAHLFEPFFTTKGMGKGVGLGLSTVYGIVTQTGGCPEIKSKLGEGTTVRIYLPRYLSEEKKKEDREEKSFDDREALNLKVLVVEDDKNIRQIIQVLLSQHGCEVFQAEDGEEGLAIFKREEGDFDLVITDVVLPRQSGPDMINQFLKIKEDLKIIYISGYTAPPEAMKIKLGPTSTFLQKPFIPAVLLEAILSLLKK